MSEHFIRRMDVAEFKDFYKRIEKDFSPDEHAPYEVLHQQIQEGIQEALVFGEGERDLAYSICADNHDNGYVLISLLAVFQECRGQGIGSAFMKALRTMYEHKQAILLEVEQPELSQTLEESDTRGRRIKFYEKSGYYLIPKVEYSIRNIPMHLMVLPLKVSKETINEQIGQIIYQIYFKLLGERYLYKMQFQALNDNVIASQVMKNQG